MRVCMKRTTLVLEEGLLEGVRKEAQRRNCDLSTVVNDCLRAGLHLANAPAAPSHPLPVFGLGRPRVNLADRDALEAAMDKQ
jgi:hypothetical protein